LDDIGVERDAVDRTDLLALRFVEVADTFGALVRVDLVDFLALVDRTVGAFRLAHIAVDAFVRDHQCHRWLLSFAGFRCSSTRPCRADAPPPGAARTSRCPRPGARSRAPSSPR